MVDNTIIIKSRLRGKYIFILLMYLIAIVGTGWGAYTIYNSEFAPGQPPLAHVLRYVNRISIMLIMCLYCFAKTMWLFIPGASEIIITDAGIVLKIYGKSRYLAWLDISEIFSSPRAGQITIYAKIEAKFEIPDCFELSREQIANLCNQKLRS